MFIDIHCHIIPGIDDGAESYIDSYEIIKKATESGTTVMVATPHFNNPFQMQTGVDKNIILDRYSVLKKHISEELPSVKLFLGCEFLADDKIDTLIRNNNFFTINGSRYLLTEFAFDERLNNVKKYIDVIKSYGCIPVIAHPERYAFFENAYDDIFAIASKGCLFQINKDSPLGKYGENAKKLSHWILKNDLVHLFAGDCHGSIHRNADMTGLYEWLINYYPVKKINTWLHDNPKRILLDLNI